jgi:hypothetical protein
MQRKMNHQHQEMEMGMEIMNLKGKIPTHYGGIS